MKFQRQTIRAAFTLVELLTVIAIVGVLAGILIPVAGKMRASAEASGCLANLRQIALAGQLYSNDNKHLVPIASGLYSSGSDAQTWRYYLASYLALNDKAIDPVGVLTCPTDKADYGMMATDTRGRRPISYGVNRAPGQTLHQYIQNPKQSSTFAAINRPSQTIFVADMAKVTNPGAAPSEWTTTVSMTNNSFGYVRFPGDSNFTSGDSWNIFPRHNGKANVAFYDGSARSVDVQTEIIGQPAGAQNCLFSN